MQKAVIPAPLNYSKTKLGNR